MILLSPTFPSPQSWDYRPAHSHKQLFTWVRRIWTQLLKLVQQERLPTEPLPQPHTSLILFCMTCFLSQPVQISIPLSFLICIFISSKARYRFEKQFFSSRNYCSHISPCFSFTLTSLQFLKNSASLSFILKLFVAIIWQYDGTIIISYFF